MVEARVLVEFRHFASIERSLETNHIYGDRPKGGPRGRQKGVNPVVLVFGRSVLGNGLS